MQTRTNIFSSLLQQFQGQTSSFNPSANPIPQSLPFQLLPTASQFGTFFALINNFTQSSKEPQSEQDQTIGACAFRPNNHRLEYYWFIMIIVLVCKAEITSLSN